MSRIGYYSDDNQKLVSVTSCIDYTLGVADEIEVWSTKQAILAVQKEMKKRRLTQDQAIEIGLQVRHSLLKKAQTTGLEVHQAIQNFHSGIPYELEEEHMPYYMAYFNWAKDKKIEPILEETKVKNLRYGYAGRLDFFGYINGELWLLDFKTSKSVRWTYGLQLAAYKRCLEDLGYKKIRMAVVHVKPKRRGGEPLAELVEFHTPFSMFEHCLALFKYKAFQDLYAKWEERSDEAALKKDLTNVKSYSSNLTYVKSKNEFAQSSDAPGQSQDIPALLPNMTDPIGAAPGQWPDFAYQHQEEKSNPLPVHPVDVLVGWTPTNRNNSQPVVQVERTSSRRMDSQPGTQSSDEPSPDIGEAATPRILPDPFALPLGTDISAPPELSPELGNQQDPRP